MADNGLNGQRRDQSEQTQQSLLQLTLEDSADPQGALYPCVNEEETPLPRTWSKHDISHALALSENRLNVRHKGNVGPRRPEISAASVRSSHPIPFACALFYFEVEIITLGTLGNVSIGLCSENFRMNRLPGCERESYGYHGQNGSTVSSITVTKPYGEKFGVGDVIGCGVNTIDNICFYTKNGKDLGIAFDELPPVIYPIVGLQAARDEIEVNFGAKPFLFKEIYNMIKAERDNAISNIAVFPRPNER